MLIFTVDEMKERKRLLGLTNEMVAERSGVPLGTVQKVFSGATRSPRMSTLRELSRAFLQDGSSHGVSYKTNAEADAPFLLEDTSAAAAYIRNAEAEKTSRSWRPEKGSERADLSGQRRMTGADIKTNLETDLKTETETEPEAEPESRLPSGSGHTRKEYYTLPGDVRAELIDGRFYGMAPPSKLHQCVLQGIFVQLDACIQTHPESCFLYTAPSDVELGETEKDPVVQPDLFIHCDRTKETEGPHRGAPDFILEVLSPSNPENDLWRKQELYSRYGVREYWIVDPKGLRVYIFDFEKHLPPVSASFEDVVPVRISGGECSVDFRIVYLRMKHLL